MTAWPISWTRSWPSPPTHTNTRGHAITPWCRRPTKRINASIHPPSSSSWLPSLSFHHCDTVMFFPEWKRETRALTKKRASRNIGQVFGKSLICLVRVFLVQGSSEVRESCVHPFRPDRICRQVGKSLTTVNTTKIYDSQSDRQNDKWLICKCLFQKNIYVASKVWINKEGKIQGNERRGSVLRGGCKKLKCLKSICFIVCFWFLY